MCKPLSEGGQRCAAHTRPVFEATPLTDPGWDDVAAAYAATPTGAKKLREMLEAQPESTPASVEVAVRIRGALRAGEQDRAARNAVRVALARRAEGVPDEVLAPAGTLMGAMSAYSSSASWAVWGSTRPTEPFTRQSRLVLPYQDVELPSAVHARVIILGLNPGNAGSHLPNWTNFHAGGRHNDHFLAEAFRGTDAWGGYLADLHPDIVESDSGRVRPRRERVTEAVESLIVQARALGADDPVLVCLGKQSERGLRTNVALLQEAFDTDTPRIVGVPHYSSQNYRIHRGDPDLYARLVNDLLAEPFAAAGLRTRM